ncbi:MAG TPA: oligoendopeptidase F [Candidatus Eisenbacteria bacterium]|nr:oligoendopeptidase F [Candidatus Eisenbacteria bacterium]
MRRVCLLAFFALLLALPLAHAEQRSQVPEKYKWKLSDLYPSQAAWNTAKTSLDRRIPSLSKFQGRLARSADSLSLALSTMSAVHKDLTQLYNYASMLSDQDIRIAAHVAMKQTASKMYVDYGAATSYVQPEILAAGAEKVRRFLSEEPRLKDYRHYLEDILRYAPHTLSAAEEKIAAQAGAMSTAGEDVRDIFKNAEMPYPTIRLTNGERVRLDDAAYTAQRQNTNRADRDSVFRAFWGKHLEFQGTIGTALNSKLRAHVFNKDVHKYKSCLEASLFSNNIPTRVYTQLLSDVHANLPTLHRYLRLRKRMMGVDTLRYEDLYAPIVKEVELKFTPEQAMEVTLASLEPLGKDYVETLRKGMTGGWIDWMPTEGKASGAYSTGAYGIHPYQLQNFTGFYDEVGTLTHEAGHSMHTHLADTHQPYPSHDYATFVAEVASTLNENLLFHHMLGRHKDKATRLFLLGSYLDNLRTTLFRQTLFAEFELRIHERAEKGETLTGESMTKLYLDLVRTYYGHAKGVCKVNPLYGVEWAYIPHFFYNFYVYQYATSIVASTSIARGIREEAATRPTRFPKRDAYLAMMKAGGSKYPIDELKEAGVDMTTSAPFKAAIREMNTVMDEMEKLLGARQ